MALRNIVPVNDLQRSWMANSSDVRSAVQRTIASGRYVHGPEHAAFESELAAFLGTRHAAGVASGTDALVLAMQAVGCTTGSEIITVANAGGYAATAAAQFGGRVVYADVDPESLLMTAATLASVLSAETRAVVVTHLYGNLADVSAIVDLCRSREIAVIEDCAQAIGGTRDGRRAGATADVSAFSFYPTKNLGAIGDGGAVATNDPAIDATVRSLRQYGWTSRYRVERGSGRNSRLDELQAAVLRVGLGKIDALNERRRKVVERYRSALAGTEVNLVTGAGVPTVAHLAVLRIGDRASFRAALEAGGVQTDIHYPVGDHEQAGLAPPIRATELPETEAALKEIVTLPCFPEMTSDEVDRVCVLLATTAKVAS